MNPETDLPPILIGDLGRTSGIFLASKFQDMSGLTFLGKTEVKAGFATKSNLFSLNLDNVVV